MAQRSAHPPRDQARNDSPQAPGDGAYEGLGERLAYALALIAAAGRRRIIGRLRRRRARTALVRPVGHGVPPPRTRRLGQAKRRPNTASKTPSVVLGPPAFA